MYRYTLKVYGMKCGMCEEHVNNAVRQNFSVKKVDSSHTKNETVVISKDKLDEAKLKESIDKTGYEVKDVQVEEVEKHLFSYKPVKK